MAVIFPVLSHRFKQKLSGGIHDAKLASFDRSLIPWLGVNVNKAMIRNLLLTLENIPESAAKAITAPPKSLDSLAKAIINNRIALDYLLVK